ncbi:MAG: GGDEF domain-containing protein [Treponema sp.]|nr:GGDEF domain-containing protein [Treponema sp.]
MRKLLHLWRYYSFGPEQYRECMNGLFLNNLISLRQANSIIAVFAGIFSVFPVLLNRDFISAGVYLFTALVAALLVVYTNYKMQTEHASNRFIYVLITIFYTNIMLFGTYLCVWSSPDKLATIFLSFLVCALLMFINPPQFTLFLTLGAMLLFIVSAVIMKTTENWIYDVCNVMIAGVIGLYFNWQISKLRFGLEISTNMLQDERDNYMDQSTIDELTQLRNRRDFMQTFQRYLKNYRTSDDWLCLAIIDIDFFKFYNDHYGHPKGDDCLRSIGSVFNDLNNLGVYSARVGGEEFALLWFEQDISHVDAVVEHITGKIAELNIPHEKSKVSPYVTISMGVYVVRCGASNDMKALYDLADKMLYNAKESGRNCAVISGNDIVQYKIPSAA